MAASRLLLQSKDRWVRSDVRFSCDDFSRLTLARSLLGGKRKGSGGFCLSAKMFGVAILIIHWDFPHLFHSLSTAFPQIEGGFSTEKIEFSTDPQSYERYNWMLAIFLGITSPESMILKIKSRIVKKYYKNRSQFLILS